MNLLRNKQFGVTVKSANGINGGVKVIHSIIYKRMFKKLKAVVEEIDPSGFINILPASPLRGFIHGAKK